LNGRKKCARIPRPISEQVVRIVEGVSQRRKKHARPTYVVKVSQGDVGAFSGKRRSVDGLLFLERVRLDSCLRYL